MSVRASVTEVMVVAKARGCQLPMPDVAVGRLVAGTRLPPPDRRTAGSRVCSLLSLYPHISTGGEAKLAVASVVRAGENCAGSEEIVTVPRPTSLARFQLL